MDGSAMPSPEELCEEWATGKWPGCYTRAEAARLTHVPYQRIRGWERRGLVVQRTWGFGRDGIRRYFSRADLDRICELNGTVLIPEPFQPYVQINPRIQFGQPTLTESRIPVWCTDVGLEEFLHGWDYVSREQAEAAIAYQHYLKTGEITLAAPEVEG